MPITPQKVSQCICGLTNISPLTPGGQKQVFKCDFNGKCLAVKFIQVCNANGNGAIDRPVIDRIVREITLLSTITSPHLPKMAEVAPGYIVDGTDAYYYYAEIYIDGGDLRTRMSNQNLSQNELVKLAQHTNCAIDALWDQGVVHRDIKPENIMFDASAGNFVLIDVGMALAIHDVSLTPPGMIVGTARYMSPEQVAGDKRRLDCRSDFYSLGVVLYELMARQHPYWTQGMDVHETAHRILYLNPPKLMAGQGYSAELCSVVERLISKKQHLRPKNPSRLREFLANI